MGNESSAGGKNATFEPLDGPTAATAPAKETKRKTKASRKQRLQAKTSSHLSDGLSLDNPSNPDELLAQALAEEGRGKRAEPVDHFSTAEEAEDAALKKTRSLRGSELGADDAPPKIKKTRSRGGGRRSGEPLPKKKGYVAPDEVIDEAAPISFAQRGVEDDAAMAARLQAEEWVGEPSSKRSNRTSARRSSLSPQPRLRSASPPRSVTEIRRTASSRRASTTTVTRRATSDVGETAVESQSLPRVQSPRFSFVASHVFQGGGLGKKTTDVARLVARRVWGRGSGRLGESGLFFD